MGFHGEGPRAPSAASAAGEPRPGTATLSSEGAGATLAEWDLDGLTCARRCASPSCSTPPRAPSRQRGPMRTVLSNWVGDLGQPSLITAGRSEFEPIRAPYNVVLRYDLRCLAGIVNSRGEVACIAALDVEKLRRKGSGMGLDVLQASGNWIARDCLCTKSGKLKPLASWTSPGEVRISLDRVTCAPDATAAVMFRVLACCPTGDPKDWRAIGAPLIMRMDLVGKVLQQDQPDMRHYVDWVRASGRAAAEEADEANPVFGGVRLRQLLTFHSQIQEDLDRYVDAHYLLQGESGGKRVHICKYDPCPFRPIDKDRYDDHRGMTCMTVGAYLGSGGRPEKLRELAPTTQLIVDRYIAPKTRGTQKSMALLMNSQRPLRARAFVTHAWGEPFTELLETLQTAVDLDEALFLSAFSLVQAGPEETEPETPVQLLPSIQALGQMDKVVVVIDQQLTLPTRLLCDYEICMCRELHIPAFFWPHRATDAAQLQEILRRMSFHPWSSQLSLFEDRVLQAIHDSLHETDLQPPFHSKWELDANTDELQLLQNARFRQYVRDRLRSFEAAVGQTANLETWSFERLRQLHAEQERKVTLASAYADHVERASHMNQDIQDLAGRLALLNKEYPLQIEQLKQDHSAAAERRAREAEEVRQCLADELDQKEQRLDDTSRRLSEEQQTTARLQAELEATRQALAAQTAQAELLQVQLDSESERRKAGAAELLKLQVVHNDETKRHAVTVEKVQELQGKLDAEQLRFLEEEKRRSQTERDLGKARKENEASQEAIDTLHRELTQLEATLRAARDEEGSGSKGFEDVSVGSKEKDAWETASTSTASKIFSSPSKMVSSMPSMSGMLGWSKSRRTSDAET